MPPLRSNPEIVHAKPNTDEFASCIDALKTGSLAVTVLANAGNPDLEHCFTKAEVSANQDEVASSVCVAAITDNLLRPPISVISFFYRTYDAYAEAMDIDTGKPPSVVDGEVESVIISGITSNVEPRPASSGEHRSWGRFFGLGKPKKG